MVRLHQSPTFSVTHHVASSKRYRSNTKSYTTDSFASDLRSQRTSPTIHQSHTSTSSFSGAGSPSTALPITSCADPSTPTAINPSPPAFWSLDIYREPRALQAKGITRCQDRCLLSLSCSLRYSSASTKKTSSIHGPLHQNGPGKAAGVCDLRKHCRILSRSAS